LGKQSICQVGGDDARPYPAGPAKQVRRATGIHPSIQLQVASKEENPMTENDRGTTPGRFELSFTCELH
jgi:hypothetical protein